MVKRLFALAPAAFAALLFLVVVLAENGLAEPGWSVSSLARVVTSGCLVASLLGGLVPKRSDVRRHASVTFAIFAVTALGQSRMIEVPNVIYRVGCALFAVVVIASFRMPQRWATDAAAQRPVRTKGRTPTRVALLAAWSLGAAALLFMLPPASRAAERRVAKYFEGYTPDQESFVGFSSNLQLGSTRGMLQSSTVVLRATGKPVDYLRGAVLDEYDARHQRWSSSRDDQRVVLVARAPIGAADSVIRFARSAPIARGDEARWFLPRGACDLRSESGRVFVDAFGIAHPAPSETEIAFRSGLACRGVTEPRALPEPAGPGPLDTAIEPYLVKQLERASNAWAAGVTGDRARLDAFTRALGAYGYSLDVERRRNLDAVIDLIYVHREGHCELFATALALLGRRSGIPTRVVSGYRVTEYNAITGVGVVRERNAHTWVEAYVDGRWDTWDPTPAVEMQARGLGASRWETGFEVIAWSADRVLTFLWNIGLLNGGIIAGVIAAVLLVVRRFTQRAAKKTEADVLAIAKPLPAFEELAAALARAGWVRSASEPLERFARRVRESDAPWAGAVATVLLRYAELRYGGIGETGSVARDLTERAVQVRHSFRGAS